MTTNDDFYIPPVTETPAPIVLTGEQTKRRKKAILVTVFFLIIAFFVSWYGNPTASVFGERFGTLTIMIVGFSAGYYGNVWKPKN
jgi:accessory gene regulator protein AgrB